tara:strand:- start:184 stop:624 length:441 start_codon:yes stop_codon:yes gene_type:complete
MLTMALISFYIFTFLHLHYRYFEGHDDDITCFSLSPCGSLCASGQVGHAPELLVWETALDASGEIITPVNEVVVLDRKRGARRGMPPVGLVGMCMIYRELYLYSIAVSVHIEWYIRQLWCSSVHNSIILSIAHNHHTNITSQTLTV